MNEKNDNQPIASLNTGLNTSEGDSESRQPQTEQKQSSNTSVLGIMAVVFGVLGIVSWSIIFVPLSLLLGIIALFTGRIGWGISAMVLSIIGIITSPMIMMLLGIGAFLSYFGIPVPMTSPDSMPMSI